MSRHRRPWIGQRAPALGLALLLVVAAACDGEAPRGTEGGAGAASGASDTPVAPKSAEVHLPAPAMEALGITLATYEESRALLAADRLEGLQPLAGRMAQSLAAARGALGEDPAGEVDRSLAAAGNAARALGGASTLAAAREAFGEASRFLVALAGADPRLAAGRQVYECPMTEAFPKWIQPEGELANPYMGERMLSCGNPSDWSVASLTGLSRAEGSVAAIPADEVAYFTCSMHPSVHQEGAGTCPICSMDLTPVTREEVETGVIRVDAQRRQEIGVRTAPVTVEPVEITIRAVGTVTYDETELSAVSLRFEGWISRLFVEETGQPVRRGQTLFTLYSPALYAAQEELLTALASQRAARGTAAPHRADYLVEAARRRLALWDLPEFQIDEIVATGEPLQDLPVYSPASGFVVEKNVVEGEAVKPGQTLYRIAGLDRVWIDVQVYESELGLVRVGQTAEVTFPYLPGKRLTGEVDYIYPYLEGGTRTGRVRVALPNHGLELKPDMYADVVLASSEGERVVVPEEAVIYAGPRRLVFVDLGEGRLQPREIEVGIKADGRYEVLAGLSPGEVVVTSGNFLIAAESRLKSAAEQW